MKPYLSVIIPAYNEESRITKALIEVTAYLDSQGYQWEVIVVNDGSKGHDYGEDNGGVD